MNKKQNALLESDEAITPVPANQRQHWLSPAVVFGGLEFTIPVIMVGAALAADFRLTTILLILVVALALQWVGNTIAGYIGAKTGCSSSVIARGSFGNAQARFVIGTILFIVSL